MSLPSVLSGIVVENIQEFSYLWDRIIVNRLTYENTFPACGPFDRASAGLLQ